MKNTFSRQIILSVLGIALLVIAIIGVSYAIQFIFIDEKNNTMTTSSIQLSINQKRTNQLFIHSLKPTLDSVALSKDYSNTFEILVSSRVPQHEDFYYEVTLVPNPQFDSGIKIATFENEVYGYERVSNPVFISELGKSTFYSDEYLIYSGAFLNTESKDIHYYKKLRLNVWLSKVSHSSYQNVSYDIHVYAKKIH